MIGYWNDAFDVLDKIDLDIPIFFSLACERTDECNDMLEKMKMVNDAQFDNPVEEDLSDSFVSFMTQELQPFKEKFQKASQKFKFVAVGENSKRIFTDLGVQQFFTVPKYCDWHSSMDLVTLCKYVNSEGFYPDNFRECLGW